eukprot:m.31226 g.31226  ORF g.31226 m.31226 type:complete len:327 (-) comp9397_c0_seq1:300-1280(-)
MAQQPRFDEDIRFMCESALPLMSKADPDTQVVAEIWARNLSEFAEQERFDCAIKAIVDAVVVDNNGRGAILASQEFAAIEGFYSTVLDRFVFLVSLLLKKQPALLNNCITALLQFLCHIPANIKDPFNNDSLKAFKVDPDHEGIKAVMKSALSGRNVVSMNKSSVAWLMGAKKIMARSSGWSEADVNDVFHELTCSQEALGMFASGSDAVDDAADDLDFLELSTEDSSAAEASEMSGELQQQAVDLLFKMKGPPVMEPGPFYDELAALVTQLIITVEQYHVLSHIYQQVVAEEDLIEDPFAAIDRDLEMNTEAPDEDGMTFPVHKS